MQKFLLIMSMNILLIFSMVSVNAYTNGEIEDYSSVIFNFSFDNEVWEIQLLDSNGNVGRGTSLDFDSNGYPHICYFDRTNFCVKYIKFDGVKWEDPQIIGTNSTMYLSMALDSNDRPHIAYITKSNETKSSELFYVFWTGLKSQGIIIDTCAENEVSIVVGTNNFPHISYTKRIDNGVFSKLHPKYAYKDSVSWHVEFITETENCSRYSSISLDSVNVPNVIYTEEINDPIRGSTIGWNLKYATRYGNGWLKKLIATTYGLSFEDFSLALDSNNNPHVCYIMGLYDDENSHYDNDVFYAYKIDNIFKSTLIDDLYGFIYSPSIAIDSYNVPHVCYQYQGFPLDNKAELKYATIKDNNWRVELVGSGNDNFYGIGASIAMPEENNIPHISFCRDWEEGGLMYATKLREENPPNKPIITGPNKVKPDKEEQFTIVSSDPESQDLFYYIEWGDYSIKEWIGPYNSSEEITVSHSWEEIGDYIIEVKARDIYGVESDMATFDVNISKSHPTYENFKQCASQQTQVINNNLCQVYGANVLQNNLQCVSGTQQLMTDGNYFYTK